MGIEFPKGTYHIENQFAAMENNGIYRHNGIRPHLGEALDFLPPPKGLDQRVTVLGNAYSIMSLSEAKDTAWDFLMWFHSDESMLETPHFGSIAWPPVIEYATHPKWLEPFKGTPRDGRGGRLDFRWSRCHDRARRYGGLGYRHRMDTQGDFR